MHRREFIDLGVAGLAAALAGYLLHKGESVAPPSARAERATPTRPHLQTSQCPRVPQEHDVIRTAGVMPSPRSRRQE